jgi:ferredoxin
MNVDLLDLGGFHVTGIAPDRDAAYHDERCLRPALFASYADLSKLRYDYPLVLVEGSEDEACVRSLSSIVEEILREIAPPGVAGEARRRQVLKLEEAIRANLAKGRGDTLSHLWDLAEAAVISGADGAAREALDDSLRLARGALRVEGQVIDCDADTPSRFITHAWIAAHRARVRALRRMIDELVLKLSEILKSDFMKSEEARKPETLKSSVGSAYETSFDFQALSDVLAKGATSGRLPEDRRRRVTALLSVLESQRFTASSEPYNFVFDNCADALDAFRFRLPAMVEVVKAIAIAELEIRNRYRAAKHDPLFGRFDARALAPGDLALFPDYLVRHRNGRGEAEETGRILEILASGLPVKILAQTDDILGDSLATDARPAAGGAGARARLAGLAVGLNSAHVLQATAADLYRQRQEILKALSRGGPSLFSVFSGATKTLSGTPPYLVAAAARESRAFPVFTYDPEAGPDWASRFCLGGNPQPEADWPVHGLAYEDQDHQRLVEDLAFTFVDFAACDSRNADDCVPVRRVDWNDGMVPVAAYLRGGPEAAPGAVPYLLMVDADNLLQRVVVDDRLIRAARRCGEAWRSLQELGGINNSHAQRLLERERAIWEQEKKTELAALSSRSAPAPEPEAASAGKVAAPVDAAVAGETAVEAEAAVSEEAASDEPYVETARCTTCNECTDINGRMFAYDDNMQAYIADPDAGPYRQLVEAAESCQVSIIHPGKPRNPAEPGLDELIARAEPFL